MKYVKISIIISILIGFILFFTVFFSSQTSLIKLKENANTKKSNIEAVLQEKNELIPTLLDTVKEYMKHEEKIFKNIYTAKSYTNACIKNGSVKDIAQADQELDSALQDLFSEISSNYPELKSNEQMIGLQDEITSLENQIKIARIEYNTAVESYNITLQIFPTNIIGELFGYTQMERFEATNYY